MTKNVEVVLVDKHGFATGLFAGNRFIFIFTCHICVNAKFTWQLHMSNIAGATQIVSCYVQLGLLVWNPNLIHNFIAYRGTEKQKQENNSLRLRQLVLRMSNIFCRDVGVWQRCLLTLCCRQHKQHAGCQHRIANDAMCRQGKHGTFYQQTLHVTPIMVIFGIKVYQQQFLPFLVSKWHAYCLETRTTPSSKM